MTDLEHLERVALAATPGEWRVQHGHHMEVVSSASAPSALIIGLGVNGEDVLLARTRQGITADAWENNAAFIATANPSTVLSLIAEIRELREALTWIRQIADSNLEQDEKLRAQGARTLKRIADHCDEALNRARKATHSNGDVK